MLVRLEAVAPDGFGLVINDHVEPFQRSTSVPAPDPTAKQLAVVRHTTPDNALRTLPPRFGLGTIDHLLPFQRSTSVRVRSWVL
jgi:hypothetical protein